jgi:hypothetical protein
MTNQVTKLKKRLLQGTKAKCVDGRWSADELPLPERLLVVGHTRGLQSWKDGELLDELDERDGMLPDVDALNEQIPQAEWETGLDGNPKPPWAIVYCVYLIDPETAELYTAINSTYGMRIAYERLVDKLDMMQRLRGVNVTAIVKPDNRPWKTKKAGTKLRPEFTILEWREIGAEKPQPAQLPPPADNDAGAAAETTPSWEDSASSQPATAAASPTEKKKKATVGKPVKPVTAEEELNDRLPDGFY